MMVVFIVYDYLFTGCRGGPRKRVQRNSKVCGGALFLRIGKVGYTTSMSRIKSIK